MDKKKEISLYPVWSHIEEFLDEKIGLNQLAFFLNYSPWHFHRIFSNFHGETLGDYIKRLRLEKSAYALKSTNFPILEIAIETGYASNEAYTKSFKKQFGKTPLQYRKTYSKWKSLESNLEFPPSLKPDEIFIQEISDFSIAYVRRFGSYENFPGLIEGEETKILNQFIQDVQSEPNNHKWIGISQDDPQITKSDLIRFDLGITIGNLRLTKIPKSLGIQKVSGGKYLIFRNRGDYSLLPEVYDWILNRYIPNKFQLRNLPPFEIYTNPFESCMKKRITDLYFPIHSLSNYKRKSINPKAN